ncbi:MAG: hypothetical protein JWM34_3452 [Ilumatobacteraceae bacterium]|nr:hypothetical protein [Ilumatobacteraceae bacterium]
MQWSPSPFLVGAIGWLVDGDPTEACGRCGFDWSVAHADALGLVERAPARYATLLDGRDGMAAAADGGWNATSYVWHLTDLARSWSERWVQLGSQPGSLLAGWDPDVLADARNYRALPTVAALWAMREAVSTVVDLTRAVGFDVTFEHGQWGRGVVGDGIVWLAHELVHHELDVDARASGSNRV